MSAGSNWKVFTESKFPWEREALEFVRQRFPSHEPYRAWSNFEFIAIDGSINECDLLVFSPEGFFLIEIKSRPGRLTGDAGTWTWITDGRPYTIDNPLFATNLKANKLAKLLERQKVGQSKSRIPYVESLVFCSAEGLQCDLPEAAKSHVCFRDREQADGSTKSGGILATITRRECQGIGPKKFGAYDRPTAKLISQAMEQAGIRESQRSRKVSDYVLEQLIGDGPGYQDWQAHHVQIPDSKRRVRLYLVSAAATPEDRATTQKAALREYQILENLAHSGILRALILTEHELGPAILFEHDPVSIRLDHFLAQQKDKLSIDRQLDLIRQLGEVVKFAHEKKVVHRALSPQSVLVFNPTSDRPLLKVFNWQTGYRDGSTTNPARGITATSHIDRLVESASTAYMAPESFNDDNLGEHLDLFSLGAIAYHIFSGSPPAGNRLELNDLLRDSSGLRISSVCNAVNPTLERLIQHSTNPLVNDRIESADEFLDSLNMIEEELTSPETDYVDDPTRAHAGELLEGGFKVIRRLGQGACSVAFLVERKTEYFVLKIASEPDNDIRVREEASVLQKLRHSNIVDLVEELDISGRAAFLMRPVFAEKEKKSIETLGQRLRREGRLSIDLLQRFGEDLLGVVAYIEEQGIPHRDIKPDNIAVGMVGRSNKLHLVLFDFSLSRTPAENIRAGTNGYLEPLLPLRKPAPPRWDLFAERYSAAVTLYELATGTLPKWGDGTTDPSFLKSDVEITLDPELIDSALREDLTEFFRKAFRRNTAERFDNGEQMLRAWRDSFEQIDSSEGTTDHADAKQLQASLAAATFDTHISELGLGTRATNALDRTNVLTVEDLLSIPLRRINRLRGVGNKTRREISEVVKILRQRLGNPATDVVPSTETDTPEDPAQVKNLSIDLICDRLLKGSRRGKETSRPIKECYLAIDPRIASPWPSQSEIASVVGVTRGRISQVVNKFPLEWEKDAALKELRDELPEILRAQGGVMFLDELVDALLVARGSSEDEPKRSRLARGVLRACVEVERTLEDPRLFIRRDDESVMIASSLSLAAAVGRLGEVADRLADEDPLAAPSRAIDQLRAVSAEWENPPSDTRLLRLASLASDHASVSSRKEIYPRGMSAARALKLSQGAILGVPFLTVDNIRDRVSSRYPDAEPLPDRPVLDELIRECGFELFWDPNEAKGEGAYVGSKKSSTSITSASESVDRLRTGEGWTEPGQITPEEADARQFEERLQRSLKQGSFLTLLVNPRNFDRARTELCRRLPLQLIDFEELFLDALKEAADNAKVQWNVVVSTDGTPRQGDWNRLMILVGRAMQTVEAKLMKIDRTILMIYAGVLARYDQMGLLSRLAEKVGRPGGIPGLWLLLPGEQPLLDGKSVPLLGPGQRGLIPTSWLENRHRANGNSVAL